MGSGHLPKFLGTEVAWLLGLCLVGCGILRLWPFALPSRQDTPLEEAQSSSSAQGNEQE